MIGQMRNKGSERRNQVWLIWGRILEGQTLLVLIYLWDPIKKLRYQVDFEHMSLDYNGEIWMRNIQSHSRYLKHVDEWMDFWILFFMMITDQGRQYITRKTLDVHSLVLGLLCDNWSFKRFWHQDFSTLGILSENVTLTRNQG